MAIKKTTNKEAQLQAIHNFWTWFTANVEELIALYEGEQFERLGQYLSDQLDRIEPRLAWEIGPGENQPHRLTISSEGDLQLRQITDLTVKLAPPLKGWELYSSKQARSPSAVVRLPESGESFDTSRWQFAPLEHAAIGRLDLIIVDEHLARSDRETALRAVSIYLDELLGEDIVERWIGSFEVKSPIMLHGKTTYKITELPDYLEWATNRKKKPLVKRNTQ